MIREAVRNHLSRRLGVPAIPRALDHLRRNGFSPKFIFDVGAYRGDFARMCIERWPSVDVACFEGQSSLESSLQDIPGVTPYMTLVGAEKRESVPFNVVDTASSVLTEHISKHPQVHVPMTTLDEVWRRDFAGRTVDLLKLDVQGYEGEVIKGATDMLARTEVIISEVNLIDIHVGVPLLHELVCTLADHGFVAYDICGLTRRPSDGALWQCDMVFVKEDHPLRSNKAY